MAHHRPSLRVQPLSLAPQDVTRELRRMWRVASVEDKALYQVMSEESRRPLVPMHCLRVAGNACDACALCG
jgi:hypothetical protein